MNPIISYDELSDTLFIYLYGFAEPSISVDVSDASYAMLDPDTEELVGVQIEGFRRTWAPEDPWLELLAGIGSITARRTTPSDDREPVGVVVRVDDAELSLGELTYWSDAVGAVVLTPTEMEILEVLMRNCWQVVNYETLIERVWGYNFMDGTNRVDVYVRRVRRKIEPATQPALPPHRPRSWLRLSH